MGTQAAHASHLVRVEGFEPSLSMVRSHVLYPLSYTRRRASRRIRTRCRLFTRQVLIRMSLTGKWGVPGDPHNFFAVNDKGY